MWIADAARSRTIDQQAIHEFGVPSRDLMERAGQAVFEAALPLAGGRRRIVVFSGPGNNGGDGFVVARLAHEHGLPAVCCAVSADRMSPQCREQRDRALAAGVQVVEDAQLLASLGPDDLVVDALLGTGATGELRGPIADAIRAIAASAAPCVAVDIPSGIACDTGRSLGPYVRAAKTVTFGLPKPFLFLAEGLEASGDWIVAEIGFPRALLDVPTGVRLVGHPWVVSRLPRRTRNSHKGANGSVLVVAGSERMTGAALLAATGALRAGAGLVTVAGGPEVCRAIQAQLPEAMVLPLTDAADLLALQDRVDALVLGPGLTPPVAGSLAARLVPDWAKPVVLDADALGPEVPAWPGPVVLTPHPGELGRMLGCSAGEVQADRWGCARRAAKRFGATVLLKGAASVVASPSGWLWVNSTGNPGMAAGGMGDVLAGVVGTLLAQGLSPEDAAACGMFWHGAAGDACAAEIGPAGFLASELASALPRTRAERWSP
ncbi:MAG: NAD(P)H-hydrate dehydratase [Fimbriimonadaceae bacterium]|nr:NAD(P)H-hydrate dehydratase [Fimbriimonadaceae bacterium]